MKRLPVNSPVIWSPEEEGNICTHCKTLQYAAYIQNKYAYQIKSKTIQIYQLHWVFVVFLPIMQPTYIHYSSLLELRRWLQWVFYSVHWVVSVLKLRRWLQGVFYSLHWVVSQLELGSQNTGVFMYCWSSSTASRSCLEHADWRSFTKI